MVDNPFGNLEVGVVDDQVGSVENTWLGGHQRLNERAGNLRPVIHMGARAHQPVLGRFLSVDPVEGGNANDYVCQADPINSMDLDGRKPCSTVVDRGWFVEVGQGKRVRLQGALPNAYGALSVHSVLFAPRWTDTNAKFGILGSSCVDAGPNRYVTKAERDAAAQRRMEGIVRAGESVSLWMGRGYGCATGAGFGAWWGSMVPVVGNLVGAVGGCIVGVFAQEYANPNFPP